MMMMMICNYIYIYIYIEDYIMGIKIQTQPANTNNVGGFYPWEVGGTQNPIH